MKRYGTDHCGRREQRLRNKECGLDDLPFVQSERAVLTMARLYFQTFVDPRSMAWARALTDADACFSPRDHPLVAAQVLAVVQAMRLSRRSCFQFNNPTCPCCSAIVTEHERRLILTLHAMRRGDNSRAQLEMMMLCEGNRTDAVLHCMAELARTLDQIDGTDTAAAPARHVCP